MELQQSPDQQFPPKDNKKPQKQKKGQYQLTYLDLEIQEMVGVTERKIVCPFDYRAKQFDLSLLLYPELFDNEIHEKSQIAPQKEIYEYIKKQALQYATVLNTDFREQLYPAYEYQAKKGQSFGLLLLSVIVFCFGFWIDVDFMVPAIFFLVLGVFWLLLNYLRRQVTITQQFEMKKETLFNENKMFNAAHCNKHGFQLYISSYLCYLYVEFRGNVVNPEVFKPDFELSVYQEARTEIIQKDSEMNKTGFEMFSFTQNSQFGLLFDPEQLRHPNLLFNHNYVNRTQLLRIFRSEIPDDLVEIVTERAASRWYKVATWSIKENLGIDIQPYKVIFHNPNLK